jgi:hypothetical protein
VSIGRAPGGVREQLADLAAQVQSMKVAVEALQQHLAEVETLLLRLMAEQPGSGGGIPPPGQRGS